MEWTVYDTWIVVVGALSACACALLGNFLVLRRLSMMGDALSHAVLPGLAVAFLVGGSRDSLTMFLGAVIIGILTAVLVHLVSHQSQLDEGASMGVVFTSLFALGLVLVVQAANQVDLDPSCVLYGSIELAPLDAQTIGGFDIPRAAIVGGLMLLVNGLVILVFYKEFKITAFDPDYASMLGIGAGKMHYLLMILVAATCVAAFEAVGSILVVAMFVVPAACAQLLTDRLSRMIVISLLVAVVSAVAGHWAAVVTPGWFGLPAASTAGSMATMAGVLFAVVFVLAPRHGMLGRRLAAWALRLRIAREDLLGRMYRHEEAADGAPALAAGALRLLAGGGMKGRLTLLGLWRRGMVESGGGGVQLTNKGTKKARDLVRTHRLWESYLVDRTGIPTDHVHQSAEQLEHFTSSDMQPRLEQDAGRPEVDPHHKSIPPGS